MFDDWIRNTRSRARCSTPASSSTSARSPATRAWRATLRDTVLAQTKANRTFCRALAQGALETRPPLGLLADFNADELDLKLLGARPFVDAARVLALAAGAPETGTAGACAPRARRSRWMLSIIVQTLRLRSGGNRVRVAELNAIDRRVLKEAFRQATLLQQRVRLDFGL